jgi:SanA protein
MRFVVLSRIWVPSIRIAILVLISLGLVLVFANFWIEFDGRRKILLTTPTAPRPFVIVLGASVYGEHLSGALRERMTKAIELHQAGIVRKILLTGDGTGEWYNETTAMTRYALKKGIPLESIFVDQEGYSTALSLVRAKKVFNVSSAYIVSQDYHLPRAIWLASLFDIETQGIPANTTPNGVVPSFREVIVRLKDFLTVPLLKITETLSEGT